jgi:hypothetical protein
MGREHKFGRMRHDHFLTGFVVLVVGGRPLVSLNLWTKREWFCAKVPFFRTHAEWNNKTQSAFLATRPLRAGADLTLS